MMLTVLATLAAFLYCMATVSVARAIHTNHIRRLSPALIGAMVSHAAMLAYGMSLADGLNLGFNGAMVFIGWVTVVFHLIGSRIMPLLPLGLVLYPLQALVILVYVAADSGPERIIRSDWKLDLHIAFSVTAFAVLTLSALQAGALAFQDRSLRQHRSRGLAARFPPLATMESLLFQLIALGFLLLTVALVSGVAFVDDLAAQHLIHKTVLAIAAWVVFGALLIGRLARGWRGRTAIRMTLAGMVVLLLAYFGSKLVLELILQRTT